jgi:hypothetical protein
MPALNRCKSVLAKGLRPSLLAIAGGVAGLSLLGAAPAQAFNPASIDPIFGVEDALGARFDAGTSAYSVGFFFDVVGNGFFANALGVSAQVNVPWIQPYTVSLFSWEYDPAQAENPANGGYSITTLASKQFIPGDPDLVPTTQSGNVNFYWLGLGSQIALPDTSDAVDPDGLRGYAVATEGFFNEPDGNFIEQDGFVTFSSRAAYLGDGYNAQDFDFLYPFPVFEAGVNGYWNGNVSVVPGPLPVMGVAAAFGWSRRLKKKTKLQP